jgi:hypothetical protein
MANDHFLGRLPKGGDLLESLNTICADRGYTRGTVQLIGALEKAALGFYRQAEQRYVSHEVDENVEILAGLGNISIKDGKPFVHLHLTLGREDGTCLGGHAMPGCIVFACEAALLPLEGPELVRAPDQPTGLPLWRE